MNKKQVSESFFLAAVVAIIAGYMLSRVVLNFEARVNVFGGVSFGSSSFHAKLKQAVEKNLHIERYLSKDDKKTDDQMMFT